jgi:hypothetical protein
MAKAINALVREEVCGLKHPEDLVRLAGTRWTIVSRLARDPAAPGGFSLVNLRRGTARVLIPDFSGHAAGKYAVCPGPPVASKLITQGLDIRRRSDDVGELFAVNHGDRESIEVFNIDTDEHGPKLIWKGCVIIPSDILADKVTALPDGIAVTSFGSPGPQGVADFRAGRPEGFLAKWTPRGGWLRVPGSGFGGDNGVAASSDGQTLYIDDWNDGTLRTLSLRKGVKSTSIRLGDFHPDNLHLLPDGRLLIAGQVGNATKIVDCLDHPTCYAGSMIVLVDPQTRRVRFRWFLAATSRFSAASTALRYGSEYWASSFRGDCIVEVAPAPRRRL